MAQIPLSYIAAPMINQSDLPFRVLVRRYGATVAYTQMLLPDRLLHDQDYLEFHLRGLGGSADRPVVAQLCGNDPDIVVRAARKLEGAVDAVDLNLGCPQEAAREGHYGGYLLDSKDWPLAEGVVSALAHSLIVPVSAKLRLCPNTAHTVDLAERLEAAGAAWIALHARHVSARRRRQGAAHLEQVRKLKAALRVPVVSNGNVRTWEDVQVNRELTGADGIMVGETLLANPCLFANAVPDPVEIGLEYLDICREHGDTASVQTVQTHVRHFVDHQCGRRPWFNKFRAALAACETVDGIDALLRTRVQRWRGLPPISTEETESDTPGQEDDVDVSQDSAEEVGMLHGLDD